VYSCPICDDAVIVTHEDSIEHTLCEFTDECPNGCYESHFFYGHSYERIGYHSWSWSHEESSDECRARSANRQYAIAEIRTSGRRWRRPQPDQPAAKLDWHRYGF
jgi:hypothetical protein